ncbi:DUF3558 domain-containing protein [Hoyosella rhizosphaerae]|uniref:DUF3558 domain-containing protein n=1 Tax=Hoyosella rhizosphaerae TaxID=1755582 RepID=A0A916XKB2_9ACTN|nr:DUF3558 domain-containing protein [Hoyosella rhizosphaerae]MBN4927801.1 DUF3558 domain-containing protein [Hoyosella rhizosphaerae]GGC76986.1 hypothetical protein GCM10011410_32870 [Hoyosella rhizosphaerae]
MRSSRRLRAVSVALKRPVSVLFLCSLLVFLVSCGAGGQNDSGPVGVDRETATDDAELRNLLDECELVPAEQVVEVFDAQALTNTFYGAICRFEIYGGPIPVSVTMAWFEKSSLFHERRETERLGYPVENVTVAGQGGFEMRVPGDPLSCGVATRAGEGGALIWWVHPHAAGGGVDACDAAMALGELAVRIHF